jgi:hypothetical protein
VKLLLRGIANGVVPGRRNMSFGVPKREEFGKVEFTADLQTLGAKSENLRIFPWRVGKKADIKVRKEIERGRYRGSSRVFTKRGVAVFGG